MTTKQNVVDVMIGYIKENHLFDEDDATVDSGESLIESGIMDSAAILPLILFIEETFDIAIEDSEVIPENIDSVENIANFVVTKTEA